MAERVKGDAAAERAVLAGICRFGIEGLVDVSDLIDVNTFSVQSNQIIFRCLEAVLTKSTTVDIPSIIAASNELGLQDFINKKEELEFINAIFRFPIKLENVRVLAIKIKKLEVAKKLQAKIEEVHRSLSEVSGNESIDEILSLAEAPIFDLSNDLNKNSDTRPQKLFAEASKYIDHLVENKCDMIGIPTGFPIYDEVIGGGQRAGSVNLMCARPGVGKTSYAKTVALYVAGPDVNIPVLMLDTEMGMFDQIHRSIASEANILTNSVETGQFTDNENQLKQARDFAEQNKDMPYFYKNVSGKPFDEVLSIIRRWVAFEVGIDKNGKTNPCLIIYDYFKLMDESALINMQEYQAMGFQISKLTDFATLNNVSCLAFVQANRSGITQDSTDIISQSDRLLWLCGSCSFMRMKTQEEMVAEGVENGNMKIITLKTRYGAGLTEDFINMKMDGNYSRLTELLTNRQSKAQAAGHIEIETTDAINEEYDDDDAVPFND